MSKTVEDEFEDAEIVDVEPDPTLLWSGETVLVHKRKKSNVVSGGVNLLNTIIGAGILSIPFAMARQGLVFGAFLVLFVAFLSHVSMMMLGRVGERILQDYQSSVAGVNLSEGPGSPTGAPDALMSPPPGSLIGSDEDDDVEVGVEGGKSSPNGHSHGGVMSPPMSPTPGMPTSSSRVDLLDAGQKASVVTEPRVTFPWAAKRVQPWTAILLDVGMILFCLGACLAYLILIGDALPQVIGFIVDERPSAAASSLSESVASSLSSSAVSEAAAPVRLAVLRRRELWISIAVVIVAPFTFAKRLDVLKYLSWGTVVCVAYLLAMLIYYFVHDYDRIFAPGNTYDLGPRSTSAINNISVIVFSYTCQPNFFSVFDELGEPRRRQRANCSSAIACAASGTLYALFGVLGYFIGGRGVADNVVNSLPKYDTPVLIARLALVFVVTFSLPILFHPMRICFESMFTAPRFQRVSEATRRYIIAAVLVLVLWAIALAFKDLGIVLSLTGATGATILSFIVPGYLIWAAFPDARACPRGWFPILGLALAIFGVLFMIASVVLTFVNL